MEYGVQAEKSIEIPRHQLGELFDHLGIRVVTVMETMDQSVTLDGKLRLGLCLCPRPVHPTAERPIHTRGPSSIPIDTRLPFAGERANPVVTIKMFVRHTHDCWRTVAP